jgi:hypothetical protein
MSHGSFQVSRFVGTGNLLAGQVQFLTKTDLQLAGSLAGKGNGHNPVNSCSALSEHCHNPLHQL